MCNRPKSMRKCWVRKLMFWLLNVYVFSSLTVQDLSTVALEDTKKKDLIEKYTEKISVETTAIFASSRMWDDGIILPQDTRQVLSDFVCLFR